MKITKMWNGAGMFMILLVILMPFYSASALATYVSVSQNHGTANINGFLDAQGDTWTVEATITDIVGDVTAEEVSLVVGSRNAQFQSCSTSDLGAVCSYASPLESGLPENTYSFEVVYETVDNNGVTQTVSSVSNSVTAYGSSPSITFRNGAVSQNVDGTIDITFYVNDKLSTLPVVGLQHVEIVDADTGAVLQTMDVDDGDDDFSYTGKVETELTGEGTKHIKIRAVDRFGHESSSSAVSLKVDYVAPVIDQTLSFTALDRFIGETSSRSDIQVNITDTTYPITVTASSPHADLEDDPATCVSKVVDGARLYTCTWNDVLVFSGETVQLSVTAEDKFGNTVTQNVQKTFVPDTDKPVVTYYGTDRIYNEQSYAMSGKNRVILIVDEQGSGITKDTVVANLKGVGGADNVRPDECGSVEGTYVCYWDVTGTISAGNKKIYLTRFEDAVGNEGVKPSPEIVVDTEKPEVIVDSIELFGVSNSQEKEYIQSNDELLIKIKVKERNGLRFFVEMDDVIMDSATEYPEKDFSQEGWAEFNEESCVRSDDDVLVWECSLLTKPVKSGPDSVNFDLIVQDTAGNEGYKKSQSFQLLGLDEEIDPDYWEVGSVSENGFIDISSTELATLRLPVAVTLEAGTNVKMLHMDPLSCEGEDESPTISNMFLYGASLEGDNIASPTLLLEFEQFDGLEFFNVEENEDVAKFPREYNCTIQIYSQIGKNALLSAEMQKVSIDVEFALSELGAEDKALQDKIDAARDVAMNKAWSWTDEFLTVIGWIEFVNNLIVKPLIGIIEIIDIVKISLEWASKNPITNTPATAICHSTSIGQHTLTGVTSAIQGVTGILSCNANAFNFGSGTSWLGEWHNQVLGWYNYLSLNQDSYIGIEGVATGFVTNPHQVRDIQDNMLTSAVGLCVPGIVKNLGEWRNIACRKVYCLENEVAAGIPVSVCEQLEANMICKYVVGEVFEFVPFLAGLDAILNAIKNVFKDWISAITNIPVFVCGLFCPISPAGAGTCNAFQAVQKLISIIGTVASTLETQDYIGKSYCSMIE